MVEEIIALPGQPQAHPWLPNRTIWERGLKKAFFNEEMYMEMYRLWGKPLDPREAKNFAAIISFNG